MVYRREISFHALSDKLGISAKKVTGNSNQLLLKNTSYYIRQVNMQTMQHF